jgi:pentatricopeptide repeat protein
MDFGANSIVEEMAESALRWNERAEWQDQQTERQLQQRYQQLLQRQQQQQRLVSRTRNDGTTTTFRVQMSLSPSSSPLLFGCTVVEVNSQKMSKQLNLDTLQITPVSEEEVLSTSTPPTIGNKNTYLMVRSVVPDSPADQCGVQVGDVLVAVSATLGSQIWPTSTLEGLRSAISSRKITGNRSITLEFVKTITTSPSASASSSEVASMENSSTPSTPATSSAAAVAEPGYDVFELSLTKPLGFQIGQDETNHYVVVTSINENASSLVRYGIQVGDRIVAIDSALGDRLWPVSTVEGVISAVTSHLPGRKIKIQFQRPKTSPSATITTTTTREPESSLSSLTIDATSTTTTTSRPQTIISSSTTSTAELLKRCRDVLRRYAFDEKRVPITKATALQQMPAMVADKVVDALVSARSTIDAVTLSMIMHAFLSCQESEKAIRIFEMATGFAGDGSTTPLPLPSTNNGSVGIVPTESALNLYTGTILLQAHAIKRDWDSVERVFAALQGQSGVRYGTQESAPWPWTGTFGTIRPDTQCYNIVLAATAERIGETGELASCVVLDRIMEFFQQMSDPGSRKLSESPVRDHVTYNTVISALCKAKRSREAFTIFEQMKRAGLRPDKFTYTSLIKVCEREGDIQELLYDMKERGVPADVVTYNTIMKTLCEKRQWTQATRLVTEMESRGVSPDSRTYGILMNGMLKADKPNACLALFESACSSSRTVGLTENVHVYTTAITAASVLGDYERALELVSRMTAVGVKPNLQTLTAVIGACLASKKYALAAQLYEKIPTPDGYAMAQGIRAFCGCGNLDRAANMIESQTHRRRLLSGKEMMLSYQNILDAALTQKDYTLARRMFLDLLAKGFIPSKSILSTIVEKTTRKVADSTLIERDTKEEEESFLFLLFVIDSLQKRNLPLESSLYIATLSLGSQLGGRSRKLASLMARARTSVDGQQREILASSVASDNGEKSHIQARLLGGWEQLMAQKNQPCLLDQADVAIENLASLPVRIAPKDFPRLIRAEQLVASSGRRKTKRTPAGATTAKNTTTRLR